MGYRRGKVALCIVLGAVVIAAAWAQEIPEISLSITDSAGNPLTVVSPDTNDPAIGGADFLLNILTSDASDLVTFSQQVFFDSNQVGYSGYLSPGFVSGETLVNNSRSEDGAAASVAVSGIGVAGSPGPGVLAQVGFDVRENPASGELTATDYAFTTAPYADLFAVPLTHTFSGPITYTTEETPFTPTPTPTGTPQATPTVTPTEPPSTPTPDADFNDDGRVDELDLLILIRSMREPTGN